MLSRGGIFLSWAILLVVAASALNIERDPSSTKLLGARLAHLRAVELARTNPSEHFDLWVKRHNKDYANDANEYARRQKIWAENLEYAAEYNSKTKSHWIGLNHLADLTLEEYQTRFLGFDNKAHLALQARKQSENRLQSFAYADVDADNLPTAIDWRKRGAVSVVKNQEQCGSCWAFSTTGAVEGINAIYTGSLDTLSEQELVDCDKDKDQGCSGGLMDYAYEFIIKNGGIDTEDDYPYTAQEGMCDVARLRRKVVTIDSYDDVPPNDEVALKKVAAHQPVAVAVEADQKSFQLYVGGVYDDEEGCGTVLDHGVLVVGYGRDTLTGNYWIVKNSWGPDWGEAGYIRIKMNARSKEGMCGIAMAASFPIKKHGNPPTPPPTPPTPSPEYSPPAPGHGPGPEPDEPVVCDDSADCPPDTTCCCATPIFNMCLQWGCCPYPRATCCEDNLHCCPETTPKCDMKHQRCMPASGDAYRAVPWAPKQAAKRTGSFLASFLSARSGAKEGVIKSDESERSS